MTHREQATSTLINPEFIKRMYEKLAPVVQGGDDADKERALNTLAERYAKEISSPVSDSAQSSKLPQQWLLAGEGIPSLEILADIQRDYLLALAPSAEREIRKAGDLLSSHLWVEAAVGDLVPEAKERVAAEIKAHYEEALKEEFEAGSQGIWAHLNAVERLGKPRAASKIFHKTYLTTRENNRLADVLKAGKSQSERSLIKIEFSSWVCIAILAVLSKDWNLLAQIGIFAFAVLIHVVTRRIVARKGGWAFTLKAVFTSIIALAWAWYLWAFFSSETLDISSYEFMLTMACLALLIYYAWDYSRLLRKRIPNPDDPS